MAIVHVAVGVILDADGNILLSQRAGDAHQGGLWECPGGKL
ncbi:MAG: NUDIX domain-containing protein [Parahaliea sp.]